MTDQNKCFIVTYHYPKQEHTPNKQRIWSKSQEHLEANLSDYFDLEVETVTSIREA
jgi:hypothetical protein